MSESRDPDDSSSIQSSLSTTERGSLKWYGTFEALQQLINDLLKVKSKWSSPGGGSRLFEGEEVAIRWYSNNGSLTLKGEKADDLKSQLLLWVDKDKERLIDHTVLENNVGMNCDINNDLNNNMTSGFVSSSKNCCSTKQNLDDLTRSVNKLNDYVESKFNLITKEIDEMKGKVDGDYNESSMMQSLQEENRELKVANEALQERINTLLFVSSDLKASLLACENEKKSLMTVLQLLKTETDNSQRVPSKSTHDDQTWKVAGNRRGRDKPTRGDFRCSSNPINVGNNAGNLPSFQSLNKFDILADEPILISDGDQVDLGMPKQDGQRHHATNKSNKGSQADFSVKQDGQRDGQRHGQPNGANVHQQRQDSLTTSESDMPDSSQKTKETIIVLGDSIIKGLRADRIRKSVQKRVITRSFPGATSKDMLDYVKPETRKSPEHIIMHVGTNDLKFNEAESVENNIIKVCEQISQISPRTRITLSQVTQRKDVPGIENKVNDLNDRLSNLCRRKNWTLINNSNINEKGLDRFGLHLNRPGAAILAKNVINCIKGF